MRTRLVTIACALVALTASTMGESQAPGTALDQRIARIESHLVPGMVLRGRPAAPMTLAERMRFYDTPGVSIAVINGGAIEWARAYGVLEAGSSRPVSARTRFQAASISKPVAALGALRLVEQGRLALDEDVNSKLTSWKVPDGEFTKQEKVTLRRLLGHSAGLTVHGFPGYEAGAPLPSLVQILDGVKPANTEAIRADVVPGSLWRYSGGGYTVVQQLVLDVTHRPFADFMRQTVLQPLGMTDSTYEQPLPPALRDQAASGHDINGKVIDGRYHTYPELAAAGLWTTPTDLARFAIGVQQAAAGRSKVLSRSTANQMLMPQKGSYGLGLSLAGSGRAARFGHGGSNAGFQCQMSAYTETGQGAVVMTNSDQGGRLAQEILRAVAIEYAWPEYPQPREKTVAQVDPALYSAYAGRYELAPGMVITIAVSESRLMASTWAPNAQTAELLPESSTKFFSLGLQIEVEFVRAPNGTISHLIVDGAFRAPRLGT